MLTPLQLRDLRVDPRTHPRGQPHLSAASGLVRVGRRLYLVADDEHHVGTVDLDGQLPVELHRIQQGDLPADVGKRKRHKPDLEALAYLPPDAHHAHGTLLALGSGSRPNRQLAFWLALDVGGLRPGDPAVIDLSMLYQPLREQFPDLNIEGAFVTGGCLRLLQRGNKGDVRNASIDYPLADFHAWIGGARKEPPVATNIRMLDLGNVNGVPLGLTDGTPLADGGWLFSAVAEDTSDSYSDGACAGSVIGRVSANGVVLRAEALAGAPKVEGIAFAADGGLLMVTDSDDPARASALQQLSGYDISR